MLYSDPSSVTIDNSSAMTSLLNSDISRNEDFIITSMDNNIHIVTDIKNDKKIQLWGNTIVNDNLTVYNKLKVNELEVNGEYTYPDITNNLVSRITDLEKNQNPNVNNQNPNVITELDQLTKQLQIRVIQLNESLSKIQINVNQQTQQQQTTNNIVKDLQKNNQLLLSRINTLEFKFNVQLEPEFYSLLSRVNNLTSRVNNIPFI